jgi:hypothetical protein
VVICSTYNGHPADNAEAFYEWVFTPAASEALMGSKVAVFGCGNSNWKDTYQKACSLPLPLFPSGFVYCHCSVPALSTSTGCTCLLTCRCACLDAFRSQRRCPRPWEPQVRSKLFLWALEMPQMILRTSSHHGSLRGGRHLPLLWGSREWLSPSPPRPLPCLPHYPLRDPSVYLLASPPTEQGVKPKVELFSIEEVDSWDETTLRDFVDRANVGGDGARSFASRVTVNQELQ